MMRVPRVSAAMTGDLGFYWGRSWISRLIEWGERIGDGGARPPSHCFLIAQPGIIFEARWPRVALAPISEYAPAQVALFRPSADVAGKQRVMRGLIGEKLSTPYGLAAVLAFAVIEPLRALGFRPGNWFGASREDYCAELAAIFLQRLGLACGLGAPATITPEDLYAWATQLAGPGGRAA